MNRHDFDKFTTKERRQHGAWVNYFNSKLYLAHRRRVMTMEAKTKTELEIEDDSRNRND